MSLRKVNDEVFYIEDPLVLMGGPEVQFLKEKIGGTQRRRIRLCAHASTEDAVHEMFVTLTKESYIRPHKHLNKSESFHVMEGSLDLVVFDEAGAVVNVIPLSDRSSGGSFYFRFTKPLYHTVHVASDLVVFHETTSGPFKKSDTIFAPWSPDEGDAAAREIFMKELAGTVERYAKHA